MEHNLTLPKDGHHKGKFLGSTTTTTTMTTAKITKTTTMISHQLLDFGQILKVGSVLRPAVDRPNADRWNAARSRQNTPG